MTDKSKLSASQFFEAGQLNDAISALNDALRSSPLDTGKRYLLAELLCFKGEWERADKQLDMLLHQDPQLMPGVLVFRQLIRAAKAREQFYSEGRIPELIEEPSVILQKYLEALVNIREGQEQKAKALLDQAEEMRQPMQGICNGLAFNDFRDLDDTMSGVLEVLTMAGQYYWIPLERIIKLAMQPPFRPRDLLWRPVRVDILGGSEADFFLPVTYPVKTEAEEIILGRTTDWIGNENSVVRGVGQRIYLAGEDALSVMEIHDINFVTN